MNYCNTRACLFNLSALSKDERGIIYRKLHSNDLEIGRVAHNSKYRPNLDIETIVKNGYLDILIWMNDEAWNYEIFNYATKYEQLYILDWLKSKHYTFFWIGVHAPRAARKGLLSVLKWFKINIQNIDWNEVCKEAVFGGQLSILQWILVSENRIPCSRRYIVRIANNFKHFHILEWLNSIPYEGLPE